MAIYEVHLGSWRRGEDNRWLSYDELADALVKGMKSVKSKKKSKTLLPLPMPIVPKAPLKLTINTGKFWPMIKHYQLRNIYP